MRKLSSPKNSEPPRISDGLALLDELVGEDARMRKAIDEARLVLQMAAAVRDLLRRGGGDSLELESWTGVPPDTLRKLERCSFSAQGLARLRRIADALDLDVRVVLVPRPVPRRA